MIGRVFAHYKVVHTRYNDYGDIYELVERR